MPEKEEELGIPESGRYVITAAVRVFRVGFINMKNMSKDLDKRKGLSTQVSGEKFSKQKAQIDKISKLGSISGLSQQQQESNVAEAGVGAEKRGRKWEEMANGSLRCFRTLWATVRIWASSLKVVCPRILRRDDVI